MSVFFTIRTQSLSIFNLSQEFSLHGLVVMRIFLLLSFIICGCSTQLSFKERFIRNTIASSAAGFALGYATEAEYSDKDALRYLAVAGLVGALATVYLEDPEKDLQRYQSESEGLKKELDLIREPKLIESRPGTFSSRIPDKYKKLINPGEWRVYEMDEWVEDAENRLIHQDRVMELDAPSLRGN